MDITECNISVPAVPGTESSGTGAGLAQVEGGLERIYFRFRVADTGIQKRNGLGRLLDRGEFDSEEPRLRVPD